MEELGGISTIHAYRPMSTREQHLLAMSYAMGQQDVEDPRCAGCQLFTMPHFAQRGRDTPGEGCGFVGVFGKLGNLYLHDQECRGGNRALEAVHLQTKAFSTSRTRIRYRTNTSLVVTRRLEPTHPPAVAHTPTSDLTTFGTVAHMFIARRRLLIAEKTISTLATSTTVISTPSTFPGAPFSLLMCGPAQGKKG
ncbi:hypothetical protein K458DRAFT_415508 [Lentithecium fluviatile CBS 122367]|uniref:Uncharacterized protein n=1 Tax=Lentithecium fluviatile CBS 122367 TaxID=1168545 RepID=A0A6G1J9K9_9PLEO|nr:hypothetical protein K458DRAFT_415508 [Lentithecium fluviatile CBS 122367]